MEREKEGGKGDGGDKCYQEREIGKTVVKEEDVERRKRRRGERREEECLSS